jgi:hypothetical protein
VQGLRHRWQLRIFGLEAAKAITDTPLYSGDRVKPTLLKNLCGLRRPGRSGSLSWKDPDNGGIAWRWRQREAGEVKEL